MSKEELREKITNRGLGHDDDDGGVCRSLYLKCGKCEMQHYKYVSWWPCRHPQKQFTEQACDCGEDDAVDELMQLIDQYAYEYAERVIKELTLNPKERKANENDNTALILHNKGYGYGRIARVMGVGKSTAQFFVNRALRNAETELSPHRATKEGDEA